MNWMLKVLQFVYSYRTIFSMFVKKPSVVIETDSSMEEVAVNIYNSLTRKQGIRTVRLNRILTKCALQHAEWMKANIRLSHIGALGKTARERVVMAGYKGMYIAENIFICNECDGESAIKMLLKTVNARGDIIENFSDFGIARSGRYWCVILGR